MWAVYIFMLIALLKREKNNWFERNRYIGFVISFTFVIIGSCVGSYLGSGDIIERLYMRYSFFQLAPAIFLFYIFLDMRSFNNVFINTLAQGTLGVYLIHENPIWNEYIRENVLKTHYWYTTNQFIPYIMSVTVCIYLFCTLIDLIRVSTLEPILKKQLKKSKSIVKINEWFELND